MRDFQKSRRYQAVKLPDQKSINLLLGRRIRRARAEMGISQTELADRLGVSYQQIQKYESAVNRIPANRLYVISQFSGKPLHWFFENDPVQIVSFKS